MSGLIWVCIVCPGIAVRKIKDFYDISEEDFDSEEEDEQPGEPRVALQGTSSLSHIIA